MTSTEQRRTAGLSEAKPLPLGHNGTSKSVQYHEYECTECGETTRNTYCEPNRTDMLTRRLCFLCNYWFDFENKSGGTSGMTIIAGHVYSPGNRISGEFRGMAGRRFDIEYIDPSVFAGQRCTTFDLWSGLTIPDHLRVKFPDTAVFLNGAEQFPAHGEMQGCWNPSERKSAPYPLPNKLTPRATPATTPEHPHG